MKQLVISCSLSPRSHSARMAERLVEELHRQGAETDLLDLRNVVLPFCDADASYGAEHVGPIAEKIRGSSAVTLAVPIYNYDVGGAARNLIALTGSAWNNKIVGLIGAAGGERSYMSLMPLANSLMLDFRCVIVPRYVYASKRCFEAGQLVDDLIAERLLGLAQDLHQFAAALGPVLNPAE